MAKRYPSWLRAATASTLVVFAAACGDGGPSGPGAGDPFDVEQSSQDFGAMQAAFDANADLAADVNFVSAAMDTLAPGGSARVYQPVRVPSEHPLMEVVRTTRFSLGASSAQPLLPGDLLGKTYEWNETESGYVESAATGAPANGVRFVTYDRTSTPFVANGYLDITDESDPSTDRLGVLLVKDGVTRLDYDVSVAQTTSSVAIAVSGFVSDGTQQVDIDVSETAAETASGLDTNVVFDLSLTGQSLSVHLDFGLSFTSSSTSTTLGASFVNGANELVLEMSQAGEAPIDGTVSWNGDLVMTITSDEVGNPVFLGATGEALTAAEATAIGEMFELASEGLFFLLSNVFFLGASLG